MVVMSLGFVWRRYVCTVKDQADVVLFKEQGRVKWKV